MYSNAIWVPNFNTPLWGIKIKIRALIEKMNHATRQRRVEIESDQTVLHDSLQCKSI